VVRVVENELDDCLQERCRTQAEYDRFMSRVDARLERASQGGLGVFDEPAPEPVVTQPSLWEVRWSFGSSRELRLYHAEPGMVLDLLFALKYHWKDYKGLSQADKELRQNSEMAEAAERFRRSSYYTAPDEENDPKQVQRCSVCIECNLCVHASSSMTRHRRRGDEPSLSPESLSSCTPSC